MCILEGISLLLSKAGLVMVNSSMLLAFFGLQWKRLHLVDKILCFGFGVKFEENALLFVVWSVK